MTKDANLIRDKVVALCRKQPALEAELRDKYAKICDIIDANGKGKKVYEVHHEQNTARLIFLTGIVNGSTQEQAFSVAVQSLGYTTL